MDTELMKTYIALLRGINVSGQKMINMEELKKVLSPLNLINIRTLIQSGNLIFKLPEADPLILTDQISLQIKDHFGFEVPVMIRTREELETIWENNPFISLGNRDINNLAVTFLEKVPVPENLKKVAEVNFLPDEFIFSGRDIYLFCQTGFGRTKMNNRFFESKLKTWGTTRNWKTLEKILSLAKE